MLLAQLGLCIVSFIPAVKLQRSLELNFVLKLRKSWR